jgi:hypothetical protein
MSILSAQRKIAPSFPPTIRLAARLSAVLLSFVLAYTASSFSCLAQTSSETKPQAMLRAEDINNDNAASRQGSDEVDIPTLLRESDFNGATSHERLLDYTYTQKRTRRKLDTHSKVKDEDVSIFEAYPVMGMHVLIRVSKNGSPVPEAKMLEARKRAGEDLTRAETAATDQRTAVSKAAAGSNLKRHLSVGMMVGSPGKKPVSIFWDLSDFLRLCEFSAPRRDTLNNRETIVLDFRARSGLNFPKSKSFIARLVGRLWIDKLDHVVVRLEGWLPSPAPPGNSKGQVAASPANSAIVYEQARLPTGEWFPHYVRMNSGGDQTLFNGLNWDLSFEFSDYKRFNTDVKQVEIDPPKQKAPK